MTSKLIPSSFVLGTLISAALPLCAAPVARISVDTTQAGKPVSPLLYGIFFEEINRAGDGGIYAEMIQNRSFEDADILFHDTPRRVALGSVEAAKEANDALAWTVLTSGTAQGSVSLDKSWPLHANNLSSLRLEVTRGGGRVAVASDGFRGTAQASSARRDPLRRAAWRADFDKATNGGLSIERGQSYDFSLYARALPGAGPISVNLESRNGQVLASGTIKKVGGAWNKFNLSLRARASDSQARLVVAATQPGTIWLDMVSLFPAQTWKNRKNGLRPDLMNAIAAMKPAFVRFPGGCFVEGYDLTEYPRWKDSIGDVAARPQNHSYWGYTLTNGLGYLEYLQMCEDLKAEPLFVINCGMSHIEGGGGNQAVPLDKMGPYVQDALDAIEYANGPVSSKWGAQRAKDGHPAPFGLKLLEIGNENGGPDYHARYALFHDAIKAKYPGVKLIACDWRGIPNNRPLDLIDSHSYSNPTSFLQMSTRYDNADRSGPKVYFGEYAVTQQSGFGNLQAALGEAAFIAGLERNSDLVTMSSYAPLLNRVGWDRWHPNAINFDQSRFYGTPSYHVQTMFAPNRADRVLPLQIESGQTENVIRGQVGVGTWATQAQFKDIKVTQGDKTLYESNFAQNTTAGLNLESGQWEVGDGVLRQTGEQTGTRALIGDPAWSNYTLTLQARKTGGREGFLISFGSSAGVRNWFNIGGWGNTAHAIDLGSGSTRVPGIIETGRWYNIKIEVAGDTVKAYLDGQLIQTATQPITSNLYGVAGRDVRSGEVILKVVNASSEAQETTVALNGMKAGTVSGTALVMNGSDPMAENSLAQPRQIAPRNQTIRVQGPTFTHIFPARSVTVMRLRRS